ncbi:hypothetical protein GCM10011491_08480 [Brucella endophytica]|uniref:Uncharacterized protein n=1 Tax=Brucella endophytica TaxID=1963359 RepID=A0A916S6P4_9HYPH|nr:hypothetical protein GCM10011491_08480 [Brucella endophytica]
MIRCDREGNGKKGELDRDDDRLWIVLSYILCERLQSFPDIDAALVLDDLANLGICEIVKLPDQPRRSVHTYGDLPKRIFSEGCERGKIPLVLPHRVDPGKQAIQTPDHRPDLGGVVSRRQRAQIRCRTRCQRPCHGIQWRRRGNHRRQQALEPLAG